jgi:lipopolysaccharide export system protein LptA
MPRVARIAASFAIVTVVYWLYTMLAVPWIEPPADPQRGGGIAPELRGRAAQGLLDLQLKQLQGLFPPEAWEGVKKSIIVNLGDDRAKLLFQTYDNSRKDGWLEIKPCTIVLAPSKDEDEDERRRQSIILEADGAMLRSDPPLDIGHAKIGRLVEGQLKGLVTIRSDGKSAGPEDDLRIVTHDVKLTEKTVTTPNEVSFQWGPHLGRGREMSMKLLSGDAGRGMGAVGPNVTGVESFEMRHIDQVCLDVGSAMTPPGKPVVSTPVEIHCRGPFRFDVLKRVASFSNQVEVLKSNPSGPRDQILCDVLAVYFSQRSKEKTGAAMPATAKEPGLLDLVAERIEARGNPVEVLAPSQSVRGIGQRLEYDLLAKSMLLEGGQDMMLQQGANEIHARSVLYRPDPDPTRPMGRVLSQGPGWLRGQPPSPSGQPSPPTDPPFEAIWKGELRVEPDGQNQLIALRGGAQVTYRVIGQLAAQEIFLRLVEGPSKSPSQQVPWRPSRLQANKDVSIDSAQLIGQVQELQVWFDEADKAGASPSGAAAALTLQPRSISRSPQLPSPQAAPPSRGARQQRFEVVGRLLQVNVLLHDREASVTQLRIVDDVRVSETQTEQPGDPPVKIRGDRLEVVDADKLQAAVSVTGQPARFEGRGLGIRGRQINLNRGTNQLWIDGNGRMDLPLPADPEEKPRAAPGELTVEWQRGMEFDGRMASFQGSVVAIASKQQSRTEVRTETMDVRMQQAIRFTESSMPQRPQVEQVVCRGGVTLQHRVLDLQQQLASNNHMQVSDARINLLNGELLAGPGWLNSVRRGNPDDSSGDPIAAAIGASPAAAASPSTASNQLNCLHIQFQESLKGNLWRRELVFKDQVRITYAPVASWDAMLESENPDVLGLNSIIAHCGELTVTQMLGPLGNRRSVVLAASGNTTVEGDAMTQQGKRTHFTAQGSHLNYDEATDWLVLRGEGRTYARLSMQSQPGADRPETAVQEIHYRRKTKELKTVGVISLQLDSLPNLNGQPIRGEKKK